MCCVMEAANMYIVNVLYGSCIHVWCSELGFHHDVSCLYVYIYTCVCPP